MPNLPNFQCGCRCASWLQQQARRQVWFGSAIPGHGARYRELPVFLMGQKRYGFEVFENWHPLLYIIMPRTETNLTFTFISVESYSTQMSDARFTQQWGALIQLLLQCKNNKHYIFWVCICILIHPAGTAHAPYYIVICQSGCIIFCYIVS
jgi:hypothetical protein